MKIACTTTGNDLQSPVDPRFGRAQKLLIFDTDTDTFTVIDNAGGVAAAQGAGIQAAEAVVRAGAVALISGHIGPKAFRALRANNVAMYTTDVPTVAEAIARYKAGLLVESKSADVNGHW
ncbi:MAG TPA: NifB/NifX family molybdenum-iron cluster-binding protein [bacterium]|nr:NifB/NifX family molybdenum-iron cluster-binding protein [bacterium]